MKNKKSKILINIKRQLNGFNINVGKNKMFPNSVNRKFFKNYD